jgi:hypothetical protein
MTNYCQQCLITIILVALLSACGTVTITESGQPDLQLPPQYSESKPFYLGGLIGEHTINTQEICNARPVSQMQTRYDAMDVLWGAVTLGIYLPRTAKVWCERKQAQ